MENTEKEKFPAPIHNHFYPLSDSLGSSLSRFYSNHNIQRTNKIFFRPDQDKLAQIVHTWWKGNSGNFAVSPSHKLYAEVWNQSLIIRKTESLEIIAQTQLNIPSTFSYKHNVGISGVARVFWKQDEYVAIGYNTGLLEVYDIQGKFVRSRKFCGCFGSGAWSSNDLLIISLFPTPQYSTEPEIGTCLYDATFFVSKGILRLLESLTQKVCIPTNFSLNPTETHLIGVSSFFQGKENYDSRIWSYEIQSGKIQEIAQEKKTPNIAPSLSNFTDDGSYCISLFDKILVMNSDHHITQNIFLKNPPGYHLVPFFTLDKKYIYVFDYLSKTLAYNYLRCCIDDLYLAFQPIENSKLCAYFRIRTFVSQQTAFGFAHELLRVPVLVDTKTMSISHQNPSPLLMFCAYSFARNAKGDIAISTAGKPSIEIFDKDMCLIESIPIGYDDVHQVCWKGTDEIAITINSGFSFVRRINCHDLEQTSEIYKEGSFVYLLQNEFKWSKYHTTVLPQDILVEDVGNGYVCVVVEKQRIQLKLEGASNWIVGNSLGIFCLTESELRFFGNDCISAIVQDKDNTQKYEYLHPLSHSILDNKELKYTRMTVTPEGDIFLTSPQHLTRYHFDPKKIELKEIASKNLDIVIIAWHDPWHNRVIVNRRICYSLFTNDLEKIADIYLLPDGYCIHAISSCSPSDESHPGYIWGVGDFFFIFQCWDEKKNLVIDEAQKRKLLSRYMSKDMTLLACKNYSAFQSAHTQAMLNRNNDPKNFFKLQVPFIPS